MIRELAAVTFAALATTTFVGAAGCSVTAQVDEDEEIGSLESAATPGNPATTWALAESCTRLFKRHASVRAIDLAQGVIRWGCADVAGVTNPDFGQEYCEYQAVQNGKVVRKAADLTTGPVACVFTGVFTGAGQAAALKPAMADPKNLGAVPASDGIVEMQRRVNSRSAATTLLRDCSRAPAEPTATKRQRVTACYQAFAAGGANAARLEQLCKSGDVMDAAVWDEAQRKGAKIRARGEAGFEPQQDLLGCMSVTGAGEAWRNSDPMICSRTQRSVSECSCSFGAVPPSVMGFAFTGWVGDQMPSSCRLAKVNNKAYPSIAICDMTAEEISDLPLNPQYSRSLANFCHDRFAVDLVMKLPLRALQNPNTCKGTAGFCKDYMGGRLPSLLESEAAEGSAERSEDNSSRTDR